MFDLSTSKDKSEPLKIVVNDRDKFSQDKFMGQVRSLQGREGEGEMGMAWGGGGGGGGAVLAKGGVGRKVKVKSLTCFWSKVHQVLSE